MPTPFTAPADPVAAVEAEVAALPALRIPKPTVTKATTIVAEGAGGTTSWTTNETKITLARLVVLLDKLLDAGLVDALNERLAALVDELDAEVAGA